LLDGAEWGLCRTIRQGLPPPPKQGLRGGRDRGYGALERPARSGTKVFRGKVNIDLSLFDGSASIMPSELRGL
jgi:hypothetical protein